MICSFHDGFVQWSFHTTDLARRLHWIRTIVSEVSRWVLPNGKPPCPESAIELYRPSDLRLSTKLVPTFANRGCHLFSVTNPNGRRSQWPRGLRHELSSPAPALRSWVRIPLRHGCLCVFCVRIISELKLLIKSLIWIAWNWQNGLSSLTPNYIWIIIIIIIHSNGYLYYFPRPLCPVCMACIQMLCISRWVITVLHWAYLLIKLCYKCPYCLQILYFVICSEGTCIFNYVK
jgi:hypothetical protein